MKRDDSTAAVPEGLAHQLAHEHFGVSGGELAIEGLAASALVAEFGSPLFVYSANVMRHNLRALLDATHQQADVYYSVKANPNPAVIRVFAEAGAGAEIASGTEYEYARRAGVAPERILFAGPGKSNDELAHVITRGIHEIHAEAVDEIERISWIAGELGRTVSVSIRVNPDQAAQGGSMRMGGQATQFGIDEDQLEQVVARFATDDNIRIVGVHMFAGTQILDAATLIDQWQHGLAVADKLAGLLGRPLRTIDLGGGLGIPYFGKESALDLALVKQSFGALLDTVQGNPMLRDSRLIVEPGRFLVGPAGVYLARVVSMKTSRDQSFAITDGGMHHHLAASGNLGQIIKRDYPVMLANRALEPHDQPVTVVGPLCTPLDTYGRKTRFPMPRNGDLFAVLQSGAYGLTASPLGFLSQPAPAEILVDGGQPSVIRPRGSFHNPFPGVVDDSSPPVSP